MLLTVLVIMLAANFWGHALSAALEILNDAWEGFVFRRLLSRSLVSLTLSSVGLSPLYHWAQVMQKSMDPFEIDTTIFLTTLLFEVVLNLVMKGHQYPPSGKDQKSLDNKEEKVEAEEDQHDPLP